MRRSTDCWDLEIMRQWGVAARHAYGTQTTLLGLIVGAHFKSVRTWGVINQAFKKHIDWLEFRFLLARCGELWGKKGSPALYSGSNMSGSGLLPVGETYLDRFPFWFRQVSAHPAFERACGVLDAGITNFRGAELLEQNLQELRRHVKGLWGDYHYKMLYDFLVATRFLPPRWVFKYPVSSEGGTAQGLCKMFATSGKGLGPKAYAEMLQELNYQVKKESKTWWSSDHLGIVGAALCWQHRKNSVSTSKGHCNRFEQTSAPQWDRELAELHKHGFQISGYHKDIPQASASSARGPSLHHSPM